MACKCCPMAIMGIFWHFLPCTTLSVRRMHIKKCEEILKWWNKFCMKYLHWLYLTILLVQKLVINNPTVLLWIFFFFYKNVSNLYTVVFYMYNANPDSYSKKLLYGSTVAFSSRLVASLFFYCWRISCYFMSRV